MGDILIPTVIFLVFGGLAGTLLAIASRVFAVEKNEKAEQIEEILPGANCGGCGYSGCAALAEAISKGEASVNSCTVGGADVASKAAEIMGVESGPVVHLRAQVMCSGTYELARKKYVYEGVDDCVIATKIGGGSKLCPNGCVGLGTCVKVCPFEAISVIEGVAVVDYAKCRGCGLCVSACPKGIIKLIPFNSKHWVGCMSEANGKETRQMCDVGCISCRLCEKNCPTGAITVDSFRARIEYDKCIGCDNCVEKCPRHIIWSGETQGSLGLVIKRETISKKKQVQA